MRSMDLADVILQVRTAGKVQNVLADVLDVGVDLDIEDLQGMGQLLLGTRDHHIRTDPVQNISDHGGTGQDQENIDHRIFYGQRDESSFFCHLIPLTKK